MTHVTKLTTATILSMSLLTVMAGAAIAPALGIIRQHFCNEPDIMIQFIVSAPALFIILTSGLFLPLSRRMGTRTMALTGLAVYVGAGAGCFFAADIWVLLCLRALLGMSVGLIMPLSTGLLAYYFPPAEQARLMGLSAAMNQMGGVVATMLAGVLAAVEWRMAFLVYLLGLVSAVMVVAFLPDEHIGSANKRGRAFEPRQLLKFHPSVVGMMLLMTIFFVFPTNFAITASAAGLSVGTVTAIMVGLDLVAFAVGLAFGTLMSHFRHSIKYMAPVGFMLGYACYLGGSMAWLIAGSVCIGFANGVGVPYLNTIASIKGGRNSATTVMPLLAAALYAGQFVSPLLVSPLARTLFDSDDTAAPYKVAIGLCIVFLLQVAATKRYQSLPPAGTTRQAPTEPAAG